MNANGGELLEVFLQEAWEGLNELEARVGELRATRPGPDQTDDEGMAALSMLAHRLKGSAGLYGFPQLAGLAGLGERLTESRPRLHGAVREGLLDVLELITLGLRRALNDLSAGRREGEVGLYFAQIGGAQGLQALLRAAPRAFQAFRPQERTPESHTADAGPDGYTSGLTGLLQEFVRTNAEIWTYFAPEVREYLDALRSELDRGELANVTLMFRSAHTIKGSAFMVGLPVMGDLAHRLEDLMNAVREGGLPLSGEPTRLLTQGVALLERMLLAAEGQATLDRPEVEGLKARVSALLSGETPADTDAAQTTDSRSPDAPSPDLQTPAAPSRAAQTIRVGTDRLDAIMDGVGQLVMSRARLERQLARLTRLEESLKASHTRVQRVVRDFEERYLNPDLVRSDTPAEAAADGLRGTVQELFEELEFDSYDDMNILARSVTELSADLGELQGQFREGSALLRAETDTFTKLLRSLRSDVARTRRVPLAQAYARPRRWARGQKHAELVTLGGDQDVDAFVTQGLSEVLLHLVTNSYTHGKESAEERASLGKPALGRVTIDARRRGTFLDVTVSDDGRGINVQAVRDQALTRGLRSARELGELSDQDALRLIFLPGLSTAREVTSEAGRGVGMDVVASTVRRLGGELRVDSTPGVGTAFTLSIPFTQQVVDVLTVRVGPYALGFPAGTIQRLSEVDPSTVRLQDGQQQLADGTPLHLLQPLWHQSEPGGMLQTVVLETSGGPVAFAVDRFEGIAESVIVAPGPYLDALGYVANTTVTPDGEPVLLPDPAGLARLAVRLRLQGQALAGPVGGPLPHGSPDRRRLLLIDDSLSVRRVVSRMLERGGYEVVTASDGQEALDLLRADPHFHAILTDLEMPRANGFEVIEEVRRRDASVPIIVMTTRAGEKHQRLAFQLGANDYFSKPVDEALLIRCLSTLTAVPEGRTV